MHRVSEVKRFGVHEGLVDVAYNVTKNYLKQKLK